MSDEQEGLKRLDGRFAIRPSMGGSQLNLTADCVVELENGQTFLVLNPQTAKFLGFHSTFLPRKKRRLKETWMDCHWACKQCRVSTTMSGICSQSKGLQGQSSMGKLRMLCPWVK
ncbi:hypothetical protein BDBG_01174 [Blastomyces gilchristii SLH14081]|uniref:Uncharacterized protein n=1 Tax=Blastomyces gilchristii (strain SLH14081) TaxID=559298 RepID=A0A179U9K4_BLAGS|nr:uncharacterized protein BDBG_01174 [Blastomyces gilchristii SLH14081]OAT04654.1 hypothetical protein BDBG_01174 [Blastomyces gilchristii SLH14081]